MQTIMDNWRYECVNSGTDPFARLCDAEFESCDSADTAMREGVDVVADALAQSFAKRAVAAEVAEIVI